MDAFFCSSSGSAATSRGKAASAKTDSKAAAWRGETPYLVD